ncbi:MAG: thioredoxin family protein [Planctomycetota bacterium]
MKSIRPWIAVVLVGLAAWFVLRPAESVDPAALGGVWAPSLAEAQAASVEQGRPVLLYVTADWCGPCRVFKKDVLTDAGVQAKLGALASPLMVDADTPGDAGVLLDRLGVRAIPHVQWVGPAGEPGPVYAMQAGGLDDPDKFSSWLDRTAGGVAAPPEAVTPPAVAASADTAPATQPVVGSQTD